MKHMTRGDTPTPSSSDEIGKMIAEETGIPYRPKDKPADAGPLEFTDEAGNEFVQFENKTFQIIKDEQGNEVERVVVEEGGEPIEVELDADDVIEIDDSELEAETLATDLAALAEKVAAEHAKAEDIGDKSKMEELKQVADESTEREAGDLTIMAARIVGEKHAVDARPLLETLITQTALPPETVISRLQDKFDPDKGSEEKQELKSMKATLAKIEAHLDPIEVPADLTGEAKEKAEKETEANNRFREQALLTNMSSFLGKALGRASRQDSTLATGILQAGIAERDDSHGPRDTTFDVGAQTIMRKILTDPEMGPQIRQAFREAPHDSPDAALWAIEEVLSSPEMMREINEVAAEMKPKKPEARFKTSREQVEEQYPDISPTEVKSRGRRTEKKKSPLKRAGSWFKRKFLGLK